MSTAALLHLPRMRPSLCPHPTCLQCSFSCKVSSLFVQLCFHSDRPLLRRFLLQAAPRPRHRLSLNHPACLCVPANLTCCSFCAPHSIQQPPESLHNSHCALPHQSCLVCLRLAALLSHCYPAKSWELLTLQDEEDYTPVFKPTC